MTEKPTDQNKRVTVADFCNAARTSLDLRVLLGADMLALRDLSSPRFQKLGLALAGFPDYIHKGRIQILGQSEIRFLAQMDPETRVAAVRALDFEQISCLLITKGLSLPEDILPILEATGVPVLVSSKISSLVLEVVSKTLLELFAQETTIHGVLLGMYGIGVLIKGESGIGKSECALDLILRGHRLIADDAVQLKRIGSFVEGAATEFLRGYLEIRGLGIVNVRELFGVSVIGNPKEIDIVLELKRLDGEIRLDRLGLESVEDEFLGVKIPKYIIPVSPGRNLSTLVETAVRIHLLKRSGDASVKDLFDRHDQVVGRGDSKDA